MQVFFHGDIIPFFAYHKFNGFDKNADSTGLIVLRIYICFRASICLATIGVCVFCAATSVAALFDFCERKDKEFCMGLLEKVVLTAGAVAVAGGAAAALLKSSDKKLHELDVDWKETEHSYICEREKLAIKAARGDKRAARKLSELDLSHEIEKMEYEEQRRRLVEKINKKSKSKSGKEKVEVKELVEESPEAKITEKTRERASCHFCGKIIAAETKFCSHCGNRIAEDDEVLYCSNCGSEVDDETVFCSSCGHKVR